jgi:carboxymethylenebutenolidase
MDVMFAHMASLNAQTSQIDTQAMLKFVDNHAMADQSRIGAVGYCMSGPIVMWIAAQFPNRFQSIASIHGANMVTNEPDSPHLMAPQIKCESYFACAEIDKWAPPADIQKLELALKQANANYRIEWYPKVEHGFVFPQRAGMYNAKAAERHWERLFNLFERTLKLSA